jgi:hypothetical protein
MDALLAWLYPNRSAVALAAVGVAVVLAVVAWRAGWYDAARRHPRSSGLLVVAVLVVGLPLTWYLASPLVIRTALEEPAPMVDAGSVLTAPPTTRLTRPTTPLPTTASAQGPAGPTAAEPSATPAPRVMAGTFMGADEFHFARGTVRLVETAPGRFTVRFEKFSVRNGPDLHVYLSPDPAGYAPGAIELGTLKATDGSFNYRVPPDVSIEEIRSVVIWCKSFSVQFGVADLTG